MTDGRRPEDPPITFELVSIQNNPRCPQCSRSGIISALVPRTIVVGENATSGSAVAVLCAHCDIDDPDAGALITFFTVHGTVTDETTDEALQLILAWASTARPKPFDLDKIGEANEAWRRGDL